MVHLVSSSFGSHDRGMIYLFKASNPLKRVFSGTTSQLQADVVYLQESECRNNKHNMQNNMSLAFILGPNPPDPNLMAKELSRPVKDDNQYQRDATRASRSLS